ncbi:putative Serine/threonine-protein kinase involved in autophagy [Monocercomonoides exilis]|uniref:putative Serine/threonine-protein kinase involved in autophagy n=1 Tax=Monocercomonoides exilis TaxID=2049356 RepID=UPI00355AA9F6|nr:putative Serine/threonine-protein kinase involved in autophagy [Monocercomonoides exilis]
MDFNQFPGQMDDSHSYTEDIWNDLFNDLEHLGFSNLTFIGAGSFGRVYAATTKEKSIIAIKIIDQDDFKPQEFQAAQDLKGSNCPYIIKVNWMYSHPPFVCIFLEYANGKTLHEYVYYPKNKPSEAVAQYFLRQLLEGLKVIHERGYIHRDMKLENVLLHVPSPAAHKMRSFNESKSTGSFFPGGSQSVQNVLIPPILKITDFGTARRAPKKKDLTMTKCGTPLNKPPESHKWPYLFTRKGDIWSVGVCFYQMLWKCHPYEDAVPQNLRKKQLRTIHPPPSTRFPASSPPLIPHPHTLSLLQALMNPQPSLRPSAEEALRHPFFSVDFLANAQLDGISRLKVAERGEMRQSFIEADSSSASASATPSSAASSFSSFSTLDTKQNANQYIKSEARFAKGEEEKQRNKEMKQLTDHSHEIAQRISLSIKLREIEEKKEEEEKTRSETTKSVKIYNEHTGRFTNESENENENAKSRDNFSKQNNHNNVYGSPFPAVESPYVAQKDTPESSMDLFFQTFENGNEAEQSDNKMTPAMDNLKFEQPIGSQLRVDFSSRKETKGQEQEIKQELITAPSPLRNAEQSEIQSSQSSSVDSSQSASKAFGSDKLTSTDVSFERIDTWNIPPSTQMQPEEEAGNVAADKNDGAIRNTKYDEIEQPIDSESDIDSELDLSSEVIEFFSDDATEGALDEDNEDGFVFIERNTHLAPASLMLHSSSVRSPETQLHFPCSFDDMPLPGDAANQLLSKQPLLSFLSFVSNHPSLPLSSLLRLLHFLQHSSFYTDILALAPLLCPLMNEIRRDQKNKLVQKSKNDCNEEKCELIENTKDHDEEEQMQPNKNSQLSLNEKKVELSLFKKIHAIVISSTKYLTVQPSFRSKTPFEITSTAPSMPSSSDSSPNTHTSPPSPSLATSTSSPTSSFFPSLFSAATSGLAALIGWIPLRQFLPFSPSSPSSSSSEHSSSAANSTSSPARSFSHTYFSRFPFSGFTFSSSRDVSEPHFIRRGDQVLADGIESPLPMLIKDAQREYSNVPLRSGGEEMEKESEIGMQGFGDKYTEEAKKGNSHEKDKVKTISSPFGTQSICSFQSDTPFSSPDSQLQSSMEEESSNRNSNCTGASHVVLVNPTTKLAEARSTFLVDDEGSCEESLYQSLFVADSVLKEEKTRENKALINNEETLGKIMEEGKEVADGRSQKEKKEKIKNQMPNSIFSLHYELLASDASSVSLAQSTPLTGCDSDGKEDTTTEHECLDNDRSNTRNVRSELEHTKDDPTCQRLQSSEFPSSLLTEHSSLISSLSQHIHKSTKPIPLLFYFALLQTQCWRYKEICQIEKQWESENALQAKKDVIAEKPEKKGECISLLDVAECLDSSKQNNMLQNPVERENVKDEMSSSEKAQSNESHVESSENSSFNNDGNASFLPIPTNSKQKNTNLDKLFRKMMRQKRRLLCSIDLLILRRGGIKYVCGEWDRSNVLSSLGITNDCQTFVSNTSGLKSSDTPPTTSLSSNCQTQANKPIRPLVQCHNPQYSHILSSQESEKKKHNFFSWSQLQSAVGNFGWWSGKRSPQPAEKMDKEQNISEAKEIDQSCEQSFTRDSELCYSPPDQHKTSLSSMSSESSSFSSQSIYPLASDATAFYQSTALHSYIINCINSLSDVGKSRAVTIYDGFLLFVYLMSLPPFDEKIALHSKCLSLEKKGDFFDDTEYIPQSYPTEDAAKFENNVENEMNKLDSLPQLKQKLKGKKKEHCIIRFTNSVAERCAEWSLMFLLKIACG